MKRKIVLILLLLMTAAGANAQIISGRVAEVMSDDKLTDIDDYTIRRVTMVVDTGKTGMVTTYVDYSPENNEIKPDRGSRVLLRRDEKGTYQFYGFDRTRPVTLMVLIFFIFATVVGRWKGVRSLLALTLTVLILLKVYIPMIIRGSAVLPLTLLFVLISASLTLVLINGFTVKTASALGGIVCGLTVSGILAYIIMGSGKLTGTGINEMQMLKYIPSNSNLNLRHLMFAGMIIGALGAIMDIGIELSSSMLEIKKAAGKIGFSSHVKAGMRVGRDITGTMTNTLILAYTGASLPMLIIFTGYGISSTAVISAEYVALEIMRGLTGSIGLITAIPATVIISAWLLKDRKG